MLTDGAARHVDVFDGATWSDAMSQLATNGSEFILQQVRDLEYSALDRLHRRRSKTHDDATIAAVDMVVTT